MPTWTFAASAEVVAYRGARPVLVDVDPATLNATPEADPRGRDPADPGRHRRPRRRPADRDRAPRCAPRATGHRQSSRTRPTRFRARIGGPGRPHAGTIGRVGAFSFYATKTITTGEGGMLVTDDDAIADRARLMSLHGISRDAWNRYTASRLLVLRDRGRRLQVQHDRHRGGARPRPARARGRASRRAAGDRPRIHGSGWARQQPQSLLELPADAVDGSHAWHLYIVRLASRPPLLSTAARSSTALRAAGIGTSVHFIPLHLHPYYRRRWGTSPRATRWRRASTSGRFRCRSGPA